MTLPKINIKKILYATDLSENARLAFAYAISLANSYRAGLTILHVIAEQTDLEERIAGYVSDDVWAQIKQRHFDEAREALIGKIESSAWYFEPSFLVFVISSVRNGCPDAIFSQSAA